MKEADLLIVDVNEDNVLDLDVGEFSQTRLAGLLRQHNSANYIFTLKLSSNHTPEKA